MASTIKQVSTYVTDGGGGSWSIPIDIGADSYNVSLTSGEINTLIQVLKNNDANVQSNFETWLRRNDNGGSLTEDQFNDAVDALDSETTVMPSNQTFGLLFNYALSAGLFGGTTAMPTIEHYSDVILVDGVGVFKNLHREMKAVPSAWHDIIDNTPEEALAAGPLTPDHPEIDCTPFFKTVPKDTYVQITNSDYNQNSITLTPGIYIFSLMGYFSYRSGEDGIRQLFLSTPADNNRGWAVFEDVADYKDSVTFNSLPTRLPFTQIFKVTENTQIDVRVRWTGSNTEGIEIPVGIRCSYVKITLPNS